VEHLLAAFEKAHVPCTYLALDISKSSLKHNVGFLEKMHSFPGSTVRCAGLWGTFEDGLRYAQKIQGPRVFLSLGSVLCNDPWSEALKKVKNWASILKPRDYLLVGMDAHLVQHDYDKIWAAYHSRDDLYRRFFLNGFDHANRLVGETWFREQDWELLAELENPTRHRFYFRAKRDLWLGGQYGRKVHEGEEIDWFDSHKYGQDDVETMFRKAGLVAVNIWQAPNSEFRKFPRLLPSINTRKYTDSINFQDNIWSSYKARMMKRATLTAQGLVLTELEKVGHPRQLARDATRV
jgi:uncharacterized SAM-dependent methyltransferase